MLFQFKSFVTQLEWRNQSKIIRICETMFSAVILNFPLKKKIVVREV